MKKLVDPYIFIVGMPRTGSKVYQNIISSNSDIHISNEIHYINPKWIRKDAASIIDDEIGKIDSEAKLQKLVDYCFATKFFGTYWNWMKGTKEELYTLIEQSDRSHQAILESVLIFDAAAHGKQKAGAKFPVHVTQSQILFDWYPNCKVLHLTRNPLAIYASQKKKHRGWQEGNLKKFIATCKILMGTFISYKIAFKFHEKNASNPAYVLFRYEDLTTQPEAVIKRICEFVDIDFKDEMLNPPAKDSSYQDATTTKGIYQGSLNRWQDELNGFEKAILKIFLRKEIKSLYPAERVTHQLNSVKV